MSRQDEPTPERGGARSEHPPSSARNVSRTMPGEPEKPAPRFGEALDDLNAAAEQRGFDTAGPGSDARGVFLNSASEQELMRAGLNGAQIARVREARPFTSWGEVEQLEGFDEGVVTALEAAGARIEAAGR